MQSQTICKKQSKRKTNETDVTEVYNVALDTLDDFI